MGSGGETARETVAHLVGAGERVGRRAGAPLPAVPHRELLEALPAERAQGRRARPHQGAGVHRRAAVPRRASPRSPRRTRAASRDEHAPGRRRPLRPVVQGVHAGDGRGRLRRARARAAPARASRSASATTSAARASTYDPTSTSRTRRPCARSSTASAPTARSAPTRTPSRSSAPTPTVHAQAYFVYDSKKSGAQTVSHLRFGPHPIRAPYLVSRAGFIGCHHLGPPRQVDVLACAAGGRHAAAQRPAPPGGGLGRPAAARSSRSSSTSGMRLYAVDATSVARVAGLPGRTNTMLQTCFFAISGVLPARRGHRPRQGGDPQDLRQAGRRGGAPQRGSRGRRPRRPARDPGARVGTVRRATSAAVVPASAPGVRARR